MYSVSDFEGMELNPLVVPKDQYVFEYYKSLKASRIFGMLPDYRKEDALEFVAYDKWSKEQLDLLLRFVILEIDPESPLFEITGLDKKKEYALDVLQKLFPKSVKQWEVVYNEINLELALYNQKVYEFFVIVNNHEYEHWYSLKIQLHRFNSELRSAFKSDQNLNARRFISKEIKNLKIELDSIEMRLFPDNKRLARKISTLSMAEAIGGFAEKYALDGPWSVNG